MTTNNDVKIKLSWIRLYQKLNHAGKVCDHFGISRFTLRKWIRRYEEKGLDDVFNAVLYILKTGCQWRALTKNYPDYRNVHYYFTIWRDSKILDRVLKKISWRGPTKQWTDRQD